MRKSWYRSGIAEAHPAIAHRRLAEMSSNQRDVTAEADRYQGDRQQIRRDEVHEVVPAESRTWRGRLAHDRHAGHDHAVVPHAKELVQERNRRGPPRHRPSTPGGDALEPAGRSRRGRSLPRGSPADTERRSP